MIRSACAVAAAVISLAIARPARAAEEAIDVSADTCPSLHVDEISRVLDIELASVSREWTGPDRLQAQLSCDDSHLSIVVVDPVTDKRLTRTVTLDWRTGEHDRTVALLVSQLFLTSWSELLLARQAAAPGLATRPAPPPAVVQAAERIARASLAAPAISGSLALLVGPRVREIDAPIASGQVTLRPSLLFVRRWRLFVDAGYERGSATRALGSVVFSLASASAGVGARWALGRVVNFDVDLGGGAAYVDMQGNPLAGAISTSASGAVGEAFVDAGPSFVLGAVRVGLLLSAGAMVPRTIAHVSGDRDVSIGGPYFGASLVVGAAEAR
jgi:hypothetical protein